MSITAYRGKAGIVFWPACDGCKRKLPPQTCWLDARTAMQDEGWTFIHEAELGWTHLCPVCDEVEREEAGD